MNGVLLLRQAVLAALRGDAPLLALVNRIEDGAPPRLSPPTLILGEMAASDWGARAVAGLSVRIPLTLADRADRPARIADAAIRVEAVMAALPEMIGDWRTGVVRFDRARTLRSADGTWSMMIDYLARLSRTG